jgi:hypothetical protein
MMFSIKELANRPTIVKTTDRTKEAISVVDIAVFMWRYFFAPKSCEITTEHPTLLPIAMDIKIIVIG